MIKINQLSFGYSKNKLLYQNLNLALKPGRIYGLFGKNGAGKSTLLGNISGLLKPTEGSILINNQQPFERKPSFLNDFFLIPEEVYLPSISLKTFLGLNACFYPKFSYDEFRKHLEELDLQEINQLKSLSMGEQKKVIIAFALACNTSVLILDEPTNGLDIPSKTQFRKLIANAVSDEKTIIISTHQVRDLETLIDEVIIIEKGQVLVQHSIEEIAEKLVFKTIPHSSQEEFLYGTETLQGKSIVQENRFEEQSKVNLELLFSATIENPAKIQEIMKHTNQIKL
jgi:ABC-2 type transport system ATP-binding protein